MSFLVAHKNDKAEKVGVSEGLVNNSSAAIESKKTVLNAGNCYLFRRGYIFARR